MKKIILTAVLLFAVSAAFGQYALAKGGKQLNAGVGFSGWGIPVYVGLDYGVHQDVSVGGQLSFRSYSDHWGYTEYNHSIFGILGNCNYHFNTILHIPRAWDLYAGLSIGFYVWNSDAAYHGSHNSGLGLDAQVGGRYYFNNNFGLNLELGGGNVGGGGKFGISYKF